MNVKYEDESLLSASSNVYGEREETSSFLAHEEAHLNNRVKETPCHLESQGKYCHKCIQSYNKKSRNKKWNYFIIFFLGLCFGFAIWPFFMTVITYKLFYTDNLDKTNFKTNRNSFPPHTTTPSHRTSRPSSNPSSTSSSPTNSSNNDANNSKDKKSDQETEKPEQQRKKGSPHFKPIRFEEIAGIDESKMELLEVVDFIKNRERYYQMGARMPKGVLLVGPPGSGKTMLARAVATEANVPYIYTSGPEFIEIYVGQGAKRIRQLFAHARSIAPSIVFIDEIDAVGGKRSSGVSGSGTGQREHDQTLNQLLVEMDGFNNSTNIMVIGATNRIDTLDSALLRPGRFDRIVYVPLPDVNGRKKILQIYIKKIKSSLKEEDILRIARLTPGFSGADLENVVNEATILATRNKKDFVTVEEMNEARDKVSMGPERKSLRQSEHQRRITAYHEAGHAIVAYFLHPKTDPIHKATIISRGNALGYVEQIPMDDRHNYFKSQMEAKLAVCMGGRAAEEIVFGKTEASSGASSDISSATEIAYKMVTEWGMSDKLGPLNYKKRLGDGYSVNRLSAKTIATIENEVRSLVEKGKTLSEEILRKHRKELDNLALALLDKETLSGEEIKKIIDPGNTMDYTNTKVNQSETGNCTNTKIFFGNDNYKKITEKDLRNRSPKNINDLMNTPNVDSPFTDASESMNDMTYEHNQDEQSPHFNEEMVASIKKMAKRDLKKINVIKSYRGDSKWHKSQILDFDKKVKRENGNGGNTETERKYEGAKTRREENIHENEMKKFHDDYEFDSKRNRGNALKNINKLYNIDWEKKENAHTTDAAATNSNSNEKSNSEDLVEKEIEMDNTPFLDPHNIENVEEMKKFNIFEHNLHKIFLFDMFNNFH